MVSAQSGQQHRNGIIEQAHGYRIRRARQKCLLNRVYAKGSRVELEVFQTPKIAPLLQGASEAEGAEGRNGGTKPAKTTAYDVYEIAYG